MSKFARNLSALVLSFAVCAQAAPADTSPDNYAARARRFLRVLYPGLSPTLNVTIRDHHRFGDPDTLDMFTMELDQPEKGPAKPLLNLNGQLYQLYEPGPCPAACACPNPVLSADLGFDLQAQTNELQRAWVSGPLVRCRLDTLAGNIHENSEWSDARILDELKAAGAAFGPDRKTEFVRSLPIEKLKPFVGEIQVISTEFQVRELTWLVRAKWHSPDGRFEGDSFLTFEPFEGKLIQFDRHGSQAPQK